MSTNPVSPHFDEHLPNHIFDNNFHPMIDTVYPTRARPRFFYTAIAYMLSSEAAQRLVTMIAEYGFVAGNDEMAIKLFDLMPGCYVAHPFLVQLSTPENANRVHSEDTDIQDDHESIPGAPLKSEAVKLWMPSPNALIEYAATKSPLRGIKDIHVINLKSQPSLLESFLQRSGLKPGQFHHSEAIDHRALSTHETVKKLLDELFSKNIFESDTTIIARALNHYMLWRHIAATTGELHLIFEDIAEFEDNWASKWNKAYFPDLPSNTNVLFIGGMRELNIPHYASSVEAINKHFDRHRARVLPGIHDGLDHIDETMPRRQFPYNLRAYMISSVGARAMVDLLAKKEGFAGPAFSALMKLHDAVDGCYVARPMLIKPQSVADI